MRSALPSNFPGAASQQDREGSGSYPNGPPLGRYNSVLNDGLFNSLQVGQTTPYLLCNIWNRFMACINNAVRSHVSCTQHVPCGQPSNPKPDIWIQVRQGSIIDDLAESEPAYLAKQNKELRRLLVECRKELYEVTFLHSSACKVKMRTGPTGYERHTVTAASASNAAGLHKAADCLAAAR